MAICKFLKKKKIQYETHCIKNNREYDIIIPNLKKPKIIIESSNLNPTTNNERKKILQLIEQKENFPNSINLAILKRRGKSSNFSPSTYNFLLDQGLLVFWNQDLNRVISMIHAYLKKGSKDLLEYRYTDFNESKNTRNSLGGASCHKKNPNNDELKLHILLNRIKGNPEGQHVIQTKYHNSVALDNFESINNIELAYEITSAKTQEALCYLAGKIAYLKKLYKNLKFIIILTNRSKLSNKYGDKPLIKYSDAIILKNQFNKIGLISARNQILMKQN